MQSKQKFSWKRSKTSNAPISGLENQAIKLSAKDIPSKSEVRDILPKRLFSRKTSQSLYYLIQTFVIQAIVVAIGLAIPLSPKMIPIWILYAFVSGTTAMGFWVLAHECGHGAFSNNRTLQTLVGYCLHSFLLVPYFSWQRSHSIHHAFTNHITKGETHVPLVINNDGTSSSGAADRDLATSIILGKNLHGLVQLLLHLVVGWPAYLLLGKTGGPTYGSSNHFWPRAPFSKKLWTPGWENKVWLSDFGIVIVLLFLYIWIVQYGFGSFLALYLGPLLVVNIWLVIYTWLHHTDTDVPHLDSSEFSYMRGAFLSIDRPYGALFDFLHHRIGSTHVIHHIEPTIPHYHAKEATKLISESFPSAYLYNPTPIYKALWHIASNCLVVKKEEASGRYIWQQPSWD